MEEYKEPKPDLEKVSRSCKNCKDKFWNHGDCNSIREYGVCINCYKGVEEL